MEIKRVTNEQYDERFYHSEEKVNPRTNTHWFPAYHFITSMGAPVSYHLIDWWKKFGYESDRIMKQKEVRGSWVHDKAESILKYDITVTLAEIEERWANSDKDQLFVQRALQGLFNFLNEEQAVIVSSERMILGEDWGGTMDLEVRLKSDNYKALWVVDIKTSKSVFREHLQQVEAYRRTVGADRGGVLILGNQTKKRYTFTEVLKGKQDFLWKLFQAEKETAYLIMEEEKRLQPTVEEFPNEFSLKNLTYDISDQVQADKDQSDIA